jgi:hypothetical protein
MRALVGALRRTVMTASSVVALTVVVLPSAASAAGVCPSSRDGAGWTLSAATFANTYTRHAYVGNGYLSQRVPPAGMGYVATGEKTGWPLYTPRYDGAFVAGLYGADPTSKRAGRSMRPSRRGRR